VKTLADLTAPVEIQRKRLLERDVQNQCVDWARKRGYWARKFSSMTQRSVPDYLFARTYEKNFATKERYEVKFACEFKAPGKKSTAAQSDEQAIMRGAGWFVFECDDFDVFQQTVHDYEDTICAR
jgi:hypothetical protein